MISKALSIPTDVCISRSVFCGVSHVLTRIPLAEDNSSVSCTVSVSLPIVILLLSLAAGSLDCSMADGVLSNFRILFITFRKYALLTLVLNTRQFIC